MTLKQTFHASVTWQETAAKKVRQDLDKIPAAWRLPENVLEQAKTRRSIADDFIDGLLDADTRQLTNLEVPALMQMTGNGSLSAVSLVTAFCKRAAFGHQLNQNLLEIGFEQAINRAQALDKHWQIHMKPVGPLHGLPITMKDQYHVMGMGTTMAYVGWIGTYEGRHPSSMNCLPESEIVRELEALGAIVIAKSTLVQTVGFVETNNNIVGYNFNPRNQKLSSGGSSGGEGAVQALRGSAIGFGSDNGGSVSMPAASTGVYSIKPSLGRLSFKNVADSSPGQNNILTVPGLLGSSVESLKYVLKSLVESEPWSYDPEVIPLSWREQQEVAVDSLLSFGFMDFDGIVKPHPPILRGLAMIADALRAAGHELVPWSPPSHDIAMAIHSDLRNASGGYDIFERLALSGEPLIPELRDEFPNGKPDPPINAIREEKTVLRLRSYRAEYHKRWMETSKATKSGHPVNALILPVMSSAALVPGNPFYTAYVTVANVVDYTTMVIPVTYAKKDVDKFESDYSPVSETDKDIWQSYDPEIYDGAPVAIQIQCRRLEEEKLLSIGRLVVKSLSTWKKTQKAAGAPGH